MVAKWALLAWTAHASVKKRQVKDPVHDKAEKT